MTERGRTVAATDADRARAKAWWRAWYTSEAGDLCADMSDEGDVEELAALIAAVRAEKAAPITSAMEARLWLTERFMGIPMPEGHLDDVAEDLACLIEDTRDVE